MYGIGDLGVARLWGLGWVILGCDLVLYGGGIVARKPENVSWFGVTPEQGKILDEIDFYGNNGWSRNSQSEVVMPRLLGEAAMAGLTLELIVERMESIGYRSGATHELVRWERKRTTGKFGR